MNFITFEELNDCIYKNITKIPRDIDLVVGIPRSGMLVANMLGLYLNLPIADLDSLINGRLYQTGNTRKQANWITSINEAKHILIIDDSISTGEAIKNAKEKLKDLSKNTKLTYCVVYALPTNIMKVDIHFAICNQPRIFEWNYMHHWGLEYACLDIDGVICEDPTIIENFNKNKYEEFICNATPKFIPTKKVGYLITCRTEKYRPQTIEWLKKYHIEYDNLIMLNKDKLTEYNNKEYGKYKGMKYKFSDCFIFFESNYEQAVEICSVSGKQVFCIENRKLITPRNVLLHINIIKRDIRITIKHTIKKIIRKFYKK